MFCDDDTVDEILDEFIRCFKAEQASLKAQRRAINRARNAERRVIKAQDNLLRRQLAGTRCGPAKKRLFEAQAHALEMRVAVPATTPSRDDRQGDLFGGAA